MTEPAWITEAFKYIGLREGIGEADNPAIVKMYAEAGHPEARHDAVPWCAAFVGSVLYRSGIAGTGTLWALDYARWGKRIDSPVIGAIATKSRLGGGHVFFVVGYDNRFIWGLGGNQSDSVCVVPFHRDLIHSYSWPLGVNIPADYPNVAPYVERDHASAASAQAPVKIVTVKDVQAALNELEYLGGRPSIKVDNLYGPETKAALVYWQRTQCLSPTGIIDGPTRTAIAAALQARRAMTVLAGGKES